MGIFPQGSNSSQASESLCADSLGGPTLRLLLPCVPQPGGATWAAPTCGDEEDAGAEDYVVFALVELAGSHAQAPEEQQPHAEDGEDAGRSHRTCGTGRGARSVPSTPCTNTSTWEGSVQGHPLGCQDGWGD